MDLSEDIEYMLNQEKMKMEYDFHRLSWLAGALGITDRDKLEMALEFADLFNECNRNEWLDVK